MAFGKKNSTPTSNGSDSILKQAITIKGDVIMTAPLYVDCRIEGRVTGKHDTANLTVGPGGTIVGDVYSSNVDIYGSIEGNIDCTSITIHAKARVKGNIFYQMIEMESDAYVEGEIHNRPRHKQKSSDINPNKKNL